MKIRIIKCLSVIVLLGIAFSQTPLDRLHEGLFRVSFFPIFIAYMFPLCSYYLTAVRLHIIHREYGTPLSVKDLFSVLVTARFYVMFFPGFLSGIGVKWVKLRNRTKQNVKPVIALSANRAIEILVVTVLGASCFVSREWPLAFILPFVLASVFVSSSILLLAVRVCPIQRLAAYTNVSASPFYKVVALSLAQNTAALFATRLVALAVGFEISVLDLAWFKAITHYGSMLPISIAGGLGIREVSAVAFLGLLGVSKEDALLFALILSFRWVFWAFFGGLYELVEKALERTSKAVLVENP